LRLRKDTASISWRCQLIEERQLVVPEIQRFELEISARGDAVKQPFRRRVGEPVRSGAPNDHSYLKHDFSSKMAVIKQDTARATSGARGLLKKGVQGSDSSVLKDRNVHTRDNRRGADGTELPPQTAKIVIDLRRPHRVKHESGSTLENTADLCVERFLTSDLLLRLEKRTVCGVELSYHGRASCRIHLPEGFEQIPFHQIGKRFAHL
jgi:hypothetical protein